MHRRFVSPLLFTYSIICLYQHWLTNLYFVFWVIIQYYLIYSVAQMSALAIGSSFSQFLCPLDITISSVCTYVCACMFEHFLISWHYKMLWVHLLYILPQPLNQSFLQGVFIPFTGEWYWKSRSGFFASKLCQLTEQENKCVYTKPCINKCVCL